MAAAVIYVANDTLFEVDALKNAADDAFINNATVRLVSIKDAAGVDVTGVTLPLALSYVAASSGTYQGVLDKAVALTVGKSYTAIVDAEVGGLNGQWTIALIAAVRAP